MGEKRKRSLKAFDLFGEDLGGSPVLKEHGRKLRANLERRRLELKAWLEDRGLLKVPKK